MNSLKLLFITFLFPLFANAQNCEYKTLSKDYDFDVTVLRYKRSDSCKVNVNVFEKGASKKIQAIKIALEDLARTVFKNCNAVRSYSTGVNNDTSPGPDIDYGDFVIADFNFDGKEDIAVKVDVGVSGGPSYFYYLQDGKKKHFEKSSYLSNTVNFFPVSIDVTAKTLTTLVHASSTERCQTVYEYDSKSKKWKILDKKMIKY